MKHALRYFTVFCIYVLSSQGIESAPKMETDAPIADFKLPFFAESGYKKWDLSGKEGKYLGNETLKVLSMKIRVYSGDEKQQLESTIISSDALIDIKAKNASGSGIFRLQGFNYRITGTTWTWLGRESRMVVHKDARVEFNESIGAILK